MIFGNDKPQFGLAFYLSARYSSGYALLHISDTEHLLRPKNWDRDRDQKNLLASAFLRLKRCILTHYRVHPQVWFNINFNNDINEKMGKIVCSTSWYCHGVMKSFLPYLCCYDLVFLIKKSNINTKVVLQGLTNILDISKKLC